jgi:putative transposase
LRISHFSEQQILEVLKKHAAGRTIGSLVDEYQISASTIYHWRGKYQSAQAQRMYRLEQENKRLTELVAHLNVETDMLRTALKRFAPNR